MAIIKIKNQAIDLDAAEIPNLPATKITSGTFDNARISLDAAEIPNLDTAKITTGTLADARVPDLNASKITAGTLADARLPANALNSNIDLTNLSASNLTSGTIPTARITALPAGVGGSGRILQYVSNSDITTRSTTSSSFGVNSNTLQVAITPASTSSKILILVNGIGYNTNGGAQCYYTVYRGSSDLGYSNRGLAQITNPSNSDTIVSGFHIKVIDTPNTTNAVTYGVHFRAGGGTANIGYNQTRSTIYLLEIGA